jgi:hypothetical protein
MKDSLSVYRDDGPLARALGRALGRLVPLPALVLVAAGALPLLALITFGSDVPVALAAAAVAWTVLCCGVATGRPDGGRLRWAWPPAVRLCEYAGLLWLASLAGDSSLPAAFALLAAIAFRSYDLVYRLRTRGETPSPVVDALSGGWDGRLLLGAALLAAGALPAGYYVWAALAAIVFVGESLASWTSAAPGGQALDPEGDE